MNRKKSTLVYALIGGLCAINIACSTSNELQTKYGKNASYFLALQSQEKGNSSDAERFFRTAAKKADPLFARLSEEELCAYGTRPQQLQRAIDLNKKYADSESLIFACQKLYDRQEYNQIIKITNDIDYSTSDNEVAYLRCISLFRTNSTHFESEFMEWSNSSPWTQNHYRVYCESNIQEPLCALRSYVYTKDYAKAYTAAAFLLDNMDRYNFTDLPQIASDLGKAFLYGSSQYEANGWKFDALTDSFSKDAQFYINFYSGRLFSKAGSFNSIAKTKFKNAMNLANTKALYDNALWYYHDVSLNSSIKDGINSLKEYISTWNDIDYYDDFLDTLSLRICSKRMWEEFNEVSMLIQGHASKEMCAKYNYLTARLIECGFLKLSGTDASNKEQIVKSYYIKALDSGTNVYYRLLAATALELPNSEILNLFYNNYTVKTDGTNFQPEPDVELLFQGLIDFGLGDKLYETWQKYGSLIGENCTTLISTYLKNNGKDDTQDFTKSLRIASKKVNSLTEEISPELLLLMYPRNFNDYISEACSNFGEKEYIMYGLIRSESFFDAKVTSTAGAIGLSQLMKDTAKDVARKLKFADYELTDAKTNIIFGTYYLSNLTKLFEGNHLLAIFSYNGGRTRVRNWVKSAKMEFGTDELPLDLFLEVIPFAETREYGRKVVSAATMYGMLYYDIPASSVVKELVFP